MFVSRRGRFGVSGGDPCFNKSLHSIAAHMYAKSFWGGYVVGTTLVNSF